MDAVHYGTPGTDMEALFDAFISHASDDKEEIVRPLVAALTDCNLQVWYDEYQPELKDGDPHPIILQGLTISAAGIVILSHSFLAKTWPRFELETLLADQAESKKPVFLVSHGLSEREIRQYSPRISAEDWIDVSAYGVLATARLLTNAILGSRKAH
jgi:hypothetical protein